MFVNIKYKNISSIIKIGNDESEISHYDFVIAGKFHCFFYNINLNMYNVYIQFRISFSEKIL